MSSLLYFFGIILLINSSVANDSSEESDEVTTEQSNNTVPQDLYVIKTIVYEVGILTDANNDTDEAANQTHEQIDLSFFDPKHVGSEIDLSNIPLPIQTNISGVSVTGILPSNLGSILLPPNGTALLNSSFPILPNKQVKVVHNISTINPGKSTQILSQLPQILGLDKIGTNSTQDV